MSPPLQVVDFFCFVLPINQDYHSTPHPKHSPSVTTVNIEKPQAYSYFCKFPDNKLLVWLPEVLKCSWEMTRLGIALVP